jgi:hypothetical protein
MPAIRTLSPERERLPAWYDITYTGANLTLTVYDNAAEHLRKLPSKSPMMRALQSQLDLPDFIFPTENAWGFGPVLKRTDTPDAQAASWHCAVPHVCASQGDDYDWQEITLLAATLQVCFTWLGVFNGETARAFGQLFTVDIYDPGGGLNGSSLSCTVCPPLAQWISRQPDGARHEGAQAAMQAAWLRSFGSIAPFAVRDFVALMRRPKWVNLSCPGSACGLDPADYYDEAVHKGYLLSPHNIDSPVQQLTLLVGLAALAHAARRDGF